MSDGTHIEWTDATWNVANGCSVVSPGCTNCYAMRLAGTRMRHHPSRAGLTIDTKAGPVWTGEVRFNDKMLLDPLKWRRPRKIFVCAHGDLFHENVPDEWIDRVFAIMALCPHHTFQVLTKRPERMRDYVQGEGFMGGRAMQVAIELSGPMIDEDSELDPDDVWRLQERANEKRRLPLTEMWPLPNVWLGVSVEDQTRADERIPLLLDTPAAVRWLSCEPLLGPVDLTNICIVPKVHGSVRAGIHLDACAGRYAESGMPYVGQWDIRGPCPPVSERRKIDWVVAGGESGAAARPMHPDWARSLRDQCAAASVPFLFKQWGEFAPCESLNGTAIVGEMPMMKVGKKAAGRLLDGVQHDGYPA